MMTSRKYIVPILVIICFTLGLNSLLVGIIQVFSKASFTVILLAFVSGSALILQGSIFIALAGINNINLPAPFNTLKRIIKFSAVVNGQSL